MFRSKVIKKKAKNRQTLLRNLKKAQARKEPRCDFQVIPYPIKLIFPRKMYYLHADVVLMEHNNTLVYEASFFNDFKIYKNLQIINYSNQKVLKVLIENKNRLQINWKSIVDSLIQSKSIQIRQLANTIIKFSERYEAMIKLDQIYKEFSQDLISEEKIKMLLEANEKTEKMKQNLFKTYPCAEFKSQLKNGHIELTEVYYNEKYLKEMEHSLESFTTTILEEGIPQTIPYDDAIAKIRLEKYLTTQLEGFQSPVFESSLYMRNGCIKRVRFQINYRISYEKGVLGFSFIPVIVGKQKPIIPSVKTLEEAKINPNFVDMMSEREKITSNFMLDYYDRQIEGKYTNLYKVCKIRELKPCGSQ